MDDGRDAIATRLHAYLSVPAVVGHEQPFLDTLQRDFEGIGRRVRMHRGLLEVVGEQDPAEQPVALSVHVDRHGLLALGDGDLAFAAHAVRSERYGDSPGAGSRALETVVGRFAGEDVEAYDVGDGSLLARGRIESAHHCVTRERLVFRVPELVDIPAGTPVGYGAAVAGAAGTVVGQLDNAASAAVAYSACAGGFAGTVLFTTEEEIGRSWEHLWRWLDAEASPELRLLVLDTSPFPEDVLSATHPLPQGHGSAPHSGLQDGRIAGKAGGDFGAEAAAPLGALVGTGVPDHEDKGDAFRDPAPERAFHPVRSIDAAPDLDPGLAVDLDGIVLRHGDAHGRFDEVLVARLAAAAREVGTGVLYKDDWLRTRAGTGVPALGRTELGRLVAETGGRWSGATLQVPTLGYHSNRETAQLRALDAMRDVILAVGGD